MSRFHVQGPAEWLIADLAVLYAGGVTVPLYDAAPPGHCRRILRGYHGVHDRSAPDGGWFRTGDLGSLGHDGFLTLRGRASDGIDAHVGGKTEPSYS